MTAPLTIPIIRDIDWPPGTTLALEVDDVVQPDRILTWPDGDPRVFGAGSAEQTLFGFADGEQFGDGLLGAGYLGVGATVLEHRTIRRFAAGDYTIRLRAVDPVGNAGPWSAPATIRHRPVPDPPTDLRIEGDNLTWNWSE